MVNLGPAKFNSQILPLHALKFISNHFSYCGSREKLSPSSRKYKKTLKNHNIYCAFQILSKQFSPYTQQTFTQATLVKMDLSGFKSKHLFFFFWFLYVQATDLYSQVSENATLRNGRNQGQGINFKKKFRLKIIFDIY